VGRLGPAPPHRRADRGGDRWAIAPAIGGQSGGDRVRLALIGAAIAEAMAGDRGATGAGRRSSGAGGEIGGGRASGRKAIGPGPPWERSRYGCNRNHHGQSLFVRALPDFSLYPGREHNGPADTTPVALHEPTKTLWQWSDERGLI
jgi:hypothetical protein